MVTGEGCYPELPKGVNSPFIDRKKKKISQSVKEEQEEQERRWWIIIWWVLCKMSEKNSERKSVQLAGKMLIIPQCTVDEQFYNSSNFLDEVFYYKQIITHLYKTQVPCPAEDYYNKWLHPFRNPPPYK